MATLATTHPTLIDLAKRMDPDDKIADIIEMQAETNPILEDMVWMEGNLTTGHKTTVRTGLPEPTWRKLYGGVQPSKSTTAQITDNCGYLEDYAEVDKALADLNGNTAKFRLSEDSAHIEGMAQELASTIFYGNEASQPEAFTGLAPRFNTRNTSIAESAENVLHGGGSGSTNTSIWLVGWGEKSCHGIVPKGSTAGMQMTDKGIVTIENVDGNGGRMEGYRTHYRQDVGLTVRDWRYIVRAANIDVTNLTKDASGSSADIIDLMTQMLEQIHTLNGVRPVFYCNRTIKSILRRQTVNKVAQSTLSMDTVGGKKVQFFDEVPVKRCDAILNTEATVAA
jgi:hypothetical protein